MWEIFIENKGEAGWLVVVVYGNGILKGKDSRPADDDNVDEGEDVYKLQSHYTS